MQNKPGVLLLALVGSFLIYRGGKIALTDKDEQIDYMARTAWGEARGEGSRGMQAVINVIMNRVRAGSWYGATPKEVCTKKANFQSGIKTTRIMCRCWPSQLQMKILPWLNN